MFQVANELMIIADGNELYLVDLSQLGLSPGERVTVAEISETAKRLEMTMVGLCKGGPLSQVLAPHASMVIEVTEGDNIIVIADLVQH